MHDDLKTAFRSLSGTKSFTLAALTVLALGVGASTAIFSVVDAVVLRGLPFDEHDRLVAVGERPSLRRRVTGDTRDPDALSAVAPQNYVDWAAQQRVFESMAAIASGWLTLRQPDGEPESLAPEYVTAGFFDVLRVQPSLGRVFSKDNEIPGHDRVVVLSDAVWRRDFGADPRVIGRTITLDDIQGGQGTYEIVGVMPRGVTYPVGVTRPTDIWLPYVVPTDQRIRAAGSRYNYLQVIARLAPGISVDRAQAQMDQIASSLEQANPQWNKDNLIGVRPLVDHIVGARTKSWMLMLLGAVAIVLLIACANVASLLLARATSRRREVAIRSALGATRWHLIRQFLIESFLLSAAGTACAVMVAWWAVGILKASMPENVPRVTTIVVDLRVLAAAAGLCFLTAILIGIVPALQASKPELSNALRYDTRTMGGAGRPRVRSVLVLAEVALAVVLLVSAALFIGSFTALMRIDPGFSPDNVLTAQISPRIESRTQPRDSGPAFAALVERINRIPSVLHASMVGGSVPLQGGYNASSLSIPQKNIDITTGEMISVCKVTPDYHAALRIPLRRGRLFDGTDQQGSAPVVLISESAARKYFPGEDPIGQTVGVDGNRTIIGIVGDVHQTSLEMEARTAAYIPIAQSSVSGGELVVRTTGRPYDVLPAVKSAVFAVLPDVPLRNVMTMEELIGRQVAQRRLNMLLLELFGVLGLVISAAGIYGFMASMVSQRAREIAVRIALGATRSNVVIMVLLNAGALVGSGLIIGGVAAWSLSATVKAFLFGIEATDPRAFAAALVLLAGAALVASVIPARRAATIDPIVVLRAD
jgi:putative ABC transport system permease protein